MNSGDQLAFQTWPSAPSIKVGHLLAGREKLGCGSDAFELNPHGSASIPQWSDGGGGCSRRPQFNLDGVALIDGSLEGLRDKRREMNWAFLTLWRLRFQVTLSYRAYSFSTLKPLDLCKGGQLFLCHPGGEHIDTNQHVTLSGL